MTPRNITLFRYPASLDLSNLDDGLAECRLKPVGPLELSSRGFVSPFGRDSDLLTQRIGNTIRVTVGTEDKILPGSVVANALADKLAEIEKTEGRKLGGKARRRVKEDLVHAMLPTAFVRPSRVDAYIFTDIGVVAIDTCSRKAAENVVSNIRQAIGSFPALPANAEADPRGTLTGWLSGDAMPAGLMLGDECELRDPADRGAVVKIARHELQGDEVGKHLEAGKLCARLALNLRDHVEFTVGEDLILRKVKLLDGALDQINSTDRDSMLAEMDAPMALFDGEFRALFTVLETALKLSRVEV